jgi:hypothetical protein
MHHEQHQQIVRLQQVHLTALQTDTVATAAPCVLMTLPLQQKFATATTAEQYQS